MIPLIYTCERSIEVYGETQKYLEVSELEGELELVLETLQIVGSTVPHTYESFWSGHVFPWVEAYDDLQISCNLCFFGLYKQAMTCLRSCLELGLLSVYFNAQDRGHEVVRDWIRSREDTPMLRDVWPMLNRIRNVVKLQASYDLQSRLLALGYLHNYVHTKGYAFSNRFGLAVKPNYQVFSSEALGKWSRAAREVVTVLCILHLLKYPQATIRFDFFAKFGLNTPWAGFLEEFQIDRLREIIEPDLFSIVNSIAESDPNVAEMRSYLASLPDLSEGEIEQQYIDFDKMQIEGMGYERWLAIQQQIGWVDNSFQKRVGILRQWAEENGHT